jgi:hypothetical protein
MIGIVIDLDLFMLLLKIYVNHKQILHIQMTQDAHTQFTRQVTRRDINIAQTQTCPSTSQVHISRHKYKTCTTPVLCYRNHVTHVP